jgi:hypothetical protein
MKKTINTAQWNAELDTDVCVDPYTNADLTLTLQLGFRQINPAGGAAEGKYRDYGDGTSPERKIIKWTPGAWKKWTDDLVTSAQNYWHGKFWLVNNFAELEYELKGVKYRPNVWCRLEIEQANVPPVGPIQAHFVIDVVRLHPTVTWFGSHSTLYDSRDTRWVQKNTDSAGKPIMQRAHVHEIGHLLGLGHVDEGKPHCPKAGDTNAAVCYGVADADMKNVMGGGMALTTAEAKPWRDAIVQLAGKGTVGTLTDWQAKMRRHYPRTPEEVLANRSVITRPKR